MRSAHLDPQDLIGRRRTSGAFLAVFYEVLGKPQWLLENTEVEGKSELPPIISVRDYLTMIGNLRRNAPDPAYHVNYILAGVPLYRGPLDLGLQTAPSIRAALDLLVRYGNDRPGYHRHIVTDTAGLTEFELIPMTALGDARAIVVETALLLIARLAARFSGRPVPELVINLQHDEPPHIDVLKSAFRCQFRFGSKKDSITIPTDICERTSVTYDEVIWRIACLRCEEESMKLSIRSTCDQAESIVADIMTEKGRMPRLDQVADRMGISARTFIRHLRTEQTTYQEIVDRILQNRTKVLLADPSLTVSQLAAELGFPDASGFHRRFKRWFGMTPDQFKRNSAGNA